VGGKTPEILDVLLATIALGIIQVNSNKPSKLLEMGYLSNELGWTQTIKFV
jgi:hypothetical protein